MSSFHAENDKKLFDRRGGNGKASGVGGRRINPEHGRVVESIIVEEEGGERGLG